MKSIVLENEIRNLRLIQRTEGKDLELCCSDYLPEGMHFGYIVGKYWDVYLNRYFGVFEMLDGRAFKAQAFNISKVKVPKGSLIVWDREEVR